MKKIFMLLMIALTVCCFTGNLFAGVTPYQSNKEGDLDIPGVGDRPAMDNVSVSKNSYVTYGSASTTTMGCAAASGKSSAGDTILFQVVGDQTPGNLDDNNVYQIKLDAAQTSAVVVANPTKSAGYFIRGSGAPSSR